MIPAGDPVGNVDVAEELYVAVADGDRTVAIVMDLEAHASHLFTGAQGTAQPLMELKNGSPGEESSPHVPGRRGRLKRRSLRRTRESGESLRCPRSVDSPDAERIENGFDLKPMTADLTACRVPQFGKLPRVREPE